jgi:transposase
MEKKPRQKFSPEFKEDAVKLVTEEGYSIVEAARNLGVSATMLGRWKRERESLDGSVPGNPFALKEELRRLRKENKRLKMEREILKKAAAFFAKESN